MKTILAWLFASWAICMMASNAWAADATGPTPLGLGDKDQIVVSIGSGLVQQEQFYGYLESLLVRRFPERKIACRNMGWSGDTVWGEARTSGYQNPAGFDRLKKQMAELKPDIILIAYGSVESFDGSAGLDHFKEGYNKLLDTLMALTPRVALISPAFHEDLGRPTPDPTAHNQNLELYTQAIRAIAVERHLPFVDLFHAMTEAKRTSPQVMLTSNGIQLNEAGYWLAGEEIAEQLGLRPMPCSIELNRDGKDLAAGASLTHIHTAPQAIAFSATMTLLPPLPAPKVAASLMACAEPLPIVRVHGFPAGESWALEIDGQSVLTASGAQWDAGVTIASGPDIDQAQELRGLLMARSQFFYHRWNPTNDIPMHYTYIAPDYAMYDAKVAELEEKIARRCKPMAHVYEMAPATLTKP